MPGKPSAVVHRVPLSSLTKTGDLDAIRDTSLRQRIRAHVAGAEGKEFIAKLADFTEQTGVHRVRVTGTLTVIPMFRNGIEQPYKAYKGDGNYCVEIFRDEKGRWRDHIVTSFEAAQIWRRDPARLRNPKVAQNAQPLVMRLCQDDAIALHEAEHWTGQSSVDNQLPLSA